MELFMGSVKLVVHHPDFIAAVLLVNKVNLINLV